MSVASRVSLLTASSNGHSHGHGFVSVELTPDEEAHYECVEPSHAIVSSVRIIVRQSGTPLVITSSIGSPVAGSVALKPIPAMFLRNSTHFS